ncbi:MAG: hypothetical protein J7M39_07090 [Anaerolineae bacterium]|nr:hypothetical protein [Anaerolineae bacterium]
MKRSLLLSLVVLILLTSLACSALSGGSDDNGDTDVKVTNSPVSGSGDIDITVVNRSPDEICYVLMSPSAEDSWGDDWLGGDETIMPGDTQVFSLDSGTYDVRVESCDEAAMATAWEVSRDTTVTAGASGADVRLMVSNESSVEVCYVYISPTTGDDWGDDWMGEMESLQPGTLRLFYVEPDIYDLQAEDCDGEVLTEEYEVDLTEDLTWTLND